MCFICCRDNQRPFEVAQLFLEVQKCNLLRFIHANLYTSYFMEIYKICTIKRTRSQDMNDILVRN